MVAALALLVNGVKIVHDSVGNPYANIMLLGFGVPNPYEKTSIRTPNSSKVCDLR